MPQRPPEEPGRQNINIGGVLMRRQHHSGHWMIREKLCKVGASLLRLSPKALLSLRCAERTILSESQSGGQTIQDVRLG